MVSLKGCNFFCAKIVQPLKPLYLLGSWNRPIEQLNNKHNTCYYYYLVAVATLYNS